MKKSITILFLILTFIPFSTLAFSFSEIFEKFEEFFPESTTTQVINEINTSVNTRSNVINGEESEGKGKSKIYVKNIINGEEIEPIDIESDKENVSLESKIKVKEGKVYVQREIRIDSQKITKNFQTDIKNTTKKIESFPEENELKKENGKVLNTFKKWLSNFAEGLRFLFNSISNFLIK